MTRRSAVQWYARSTSITTGSPGASRRTRLSAVHEKLMTRAGEPAPAQPNSLSRSTTRRSTSELKRVGCLVSIAISTWRS